MFTNAQRQVERTGRGGTPRDQYLQDLVTQFQDSTNEECKEKIVANLSNFAFSMSTLLDYLSYSIRWYLCSVCSAEYSRVILGLHYRVK